MRIAIGGISSESCTFSPCPTTIADFTISRDREFFDRYPFLSQLLPFDAVGLLRARALPGGPVEASAYDQIKAEFLERLRAACPVEGLYLDLHGALNVTGLDDAEADFAAAARAVVGPECLIAASLDLHGNVSAQFVANCDIIAAYRSAPHIDTEATRERALRMLLRAGISGVRPVRAWVRVPVLLPGEKTSTEWDPGARLYAGLDRSSGLPGIWDSSVLVGYVWADEPRSAAAVVVIGEDSAAVSAESARLARAYWEARDEFRFGVAAGSIDECIEAGLAAPESCVFISDSGDNPTAGGAGDVPLFLARLLALKVPSAVVASITDPGAVQVARAAGVDSLIHVELGGKLDPQTCPPLAIRARVENIVEGDNPEVVLAVGGVRVIVTTRRRAYHLISDFQRLGIEPLQHRLVVVKIGYLEPDLRRAAPVSLLALSPGSVDQHIERLGHRRLQHPIYPFDPQMSFEPEPRLFAS
ncbi:MAG: M81 family metallopeptidase [Candidatus Nanopelagicales bacterium]